MTGRGRTRRAKSPDTKSANSKTSPEEVSRQNGTTKERKPKAQKKARDAEESPLQDRPTKHVIEEISKQQSATTDNTKAPVRCTKAKKKTEQAAEEIRKTQPETPKDPLKATKVKRCVVKKDKSPEEAAEEMTETQPETPKDPLKIIKEKGCVGKARSPGHKETPKACVPPVRCGEGELSILHTTLESLKIKRDERSDAAAVVNRIVEAIVHHLKKESQSFKEIKEPLHTGSYYEHLKISNPDEFDVMLPVPVDRVNVTPFGDDGAFYSVELKRGKSPLQRFQKTGGTLSASEMLKEFRDEVKKSVKQFTEWEVTKKKKGCPAVTLMTKNRPIPISLDIVLSIVVQSSWPAFTKEGIKIDGWLGTKVKQEYKRLPYYLVPKYEGVGTVECDGVLAKDVWRVSFSHVEKAMLLNHGSEKTCCEREGERCCRKDCLKLLKHLLSLLKEKDSSLTKFCSYHVKTTLLHACCSRTKDAGWSASSLSCCFLLLLEDFVEHLERGVLHNFFIPTQNLLSGPGLKKCKSLAQRIGEERENGFPIFK
ncbi:cyclic GMP-AMP synthase [Anarhichas minor]|uniref:cyclic GMP-AMP synthase n=1 Tax=Anarhichas minor TaxID=65739 RepID=UPI003F737871